MFCAAENRLDVVYFSYTGLVSSFSSHPHRHIPFSVNQSPFTYWNSEETLSSHGWSFSPRFLLFHAAQSKSIRIHTMGVKEFQWRKVHLVSSNAISYHFFSLLLYGNFSLKRTYIWFRYIRLNEFERHAENRRISFGFWMKIDMMLLMRRVVLWQFNWSLQYFVEENIHFVFLYIASAAGAAAQCFCIHLMVSVFECIFCENKLCNILRYIPTLSSLLPFYNASARKRKKWRRNSLEFSVNASELWAEM